MCKDDDTCYRRKRNESQLLQKTVVSCGETERIYIATMYPFDEESRRCTAASENATGKGI
ncbi:MAG: hypothetical protein ACLVB1_00880 [Blautia obeum]